MQNDSIPTALLPLEDANQRLRANVAPTHWKNPRPQRSYNLVVIGAGTAGLVAAAGAAGLGAKVALIESKLMGGDCLNVGCVPSKALLEAARVAATVNASNEFGIHSSGEVSIDFDFIMRRMRELRADISPADSASRFKSLGVDVFFGSAQFTGPRQVTVGEHQLNFSKAVIATGSRPKIPSIDGLDKINYLTNETIFSLTQLPARLIVLGGGPIGCEMAQAFARFGSKVILIERSTHILSHEDADAAKIIANVFEREKIEILKNCSVKSVTQHNGQTELKVMHDGQLRTLTGDALLVSVGRTPNVEKLDLDVVEVKSDPSKGIEVNDRLQTSNSRIYAIGDVASKYKFTHAADFMARIAIKNSLFWGSSKLSDLIIPHCTYTSPEIAAIGLSQVEVDSRMIAVDTYRLSFEHLDRAIVAGKTDGLVTIRCARGTDRIIGATIVAQNAGDLIGELSLAMTNKIGLSKIADAIHPYPTLAEAIRKLGDQYNKTRLTPRVKWLFDKWLTWTR